MLLQTSDNSVTTFVYHKIDLLKIEDYLVWQQKIIKASSLYKGFVDSMLIRPGIFSSEENEYVSIFKFENREYLDKWLNSPIRKELLIQANEFSKDNFKLKVFTGLEHWFITNKHDNPSRYKMTIISFLAIWPLVHFIPPILQPYLSTLNNIARETITTAAITIAMSYIALPIMTVIFKKWLIKHI